VTFLNLVQHHTEYIGTCLSQHLHNPSGRAAFHLAGSQHQNHAVHLSAQHAGVGNAQHRRRVEHHDVVDRAQFLHDPAESRRVQQFGGVRRNRTGGDNGEILNTNVQRHISQRGAADNGVGQAGVVWNPDLPVHGRTPQVAVHQRHFLGVLRKRDGQVRGGRALAFALARTGHHQRLRSAVHRQELDVRP